MTDRLLPPWPDGAPCYLRGADLPDYEIGIGATPYIQLPLGNLHQSVDHCVAVRLRGLRPDGARRGADLIRAVAVGFREDPDQLATWAAMVRLTEGAWAALTRPWPEEFDEHDLRRWRPLLARTRFLVLALPFRGHWMTDELVHVFIGNLEELVERARRARDAWEGELRRYQDRPALASASPNRLDGELRRMLYKSQEGRRELLEISESSLADKPSRPPDTREFALRMSRIYLLPRFMLWDSWTTAGRLAGRGWQVVAWTVWLLLGIAAAGPVVAPEHREMAAVVPLLAAYVLIVLGLHDVGEVFAHSFCLRLPAGTTIGLFAVLSFSPGWWERFTPWPVLLFLCSALGYIAVEGRNHGASALRAAVTMGLIGMVHAASVAAVVLTVVAPQFVEGFGLPPTGSGWAALLLVAGSAGLAAGVFAQVLWEDRPITAPLAHLEWRDSE